ncbi:MAG: DNA alkylation repair protein [Verrucomicrobiaceae bacterium]|nr:DNA alkylation repair protein [Verrucomicrobiaceae bacterium]
MTLAQIMKLLESKGTEQTRKTFRRHGATEAMFGVKVGDLKPIARAIKGNQALALELYATGNSDAMYLAGLVANGAKMTKAELNQWAKQATWHMISGCAVPWVTSEHPEAVNLALKWIDSPKELIADAGWATLSAVVSVWRDEALPLPQIEAMLDRVTASIHDSPNRVRYAMNNFVICCGTYVAPLAEKALAVARHLGPVSVDMGQTECKVPEAETYVIKSRRGNPVAAKRKTARC